jgi:hypothetical protein
MEQQQPAVDASWGDDAQPVDASWGDDAQPVEAKAPARPSLLRRGEGESDEAFIERSNNMWGEPVLPGITNVASPGKGLIKMALEKVAPRLMRNSLGAQQAVRKEFSNVDLDRVALREGAIPSNVASTKAIAERAMDAGKAVKTTAAAQGPATLATPRAVAAGGLRTLYKEAKQAKKPDVQSAVLERIKQIRSEYGPGLDASGAQARKQFLQGEGRAALSAPNPRQAGMGAQIADAERESLTKILHSNPAMHEALSRSQELMALERAMENAGNRTSLLADAIGGGAGAAAGLASGNPAAALWTVPMGMAITHATRSPSAMGRAANAANSFSQAPGQGRIQALLAQLLGAVNGQE